VAECRACIGCSSGANCLPGGKLGIWMLLMLLGYGMLLALLDYWVLGAADAAGYLVLLTLLGCYVLL